MTAYPLTWPAGWKRTKPDARRSGTFNKKIWQPSSTPGGSGYHRTSFVTVAEGTKRVLVELERMGIDHDDIVISTNLKLRLDGFPRSDQKEPDDPGVAVYWKKRKDTQHKVMAVDQYDKIANNLAAIAATLDAMRAIERHGGAMILERAFTGFTALPMPNTWRSVMGYAELTTPTIAMVKEVYRKKAAITHPDNPNGDTNRMQQLNWAMAEAERELA